MGVHNAFLIAVSQQISERMYLKQSLPCPALMAVAVAKEFGGISVNEINDQQSTSSAYTFAIHTYTSLPYIPCCRSATSSQRALLQAEIERDAPMEEGRREESHYTHTHPLSLSQIALADDLTQKPTRWVHECCSIAHKGIGSHF